MDKRFQHPFGKFAKQYREYRRGLPNKISVMAVEEMKGNFKIQGSRGDNGVENWEPRAPGSWGKNNREGRALLIKSGRLKRGLKKKPTFDYARVINDVPYAQAQNEGFKGKVEQNVKGFTRKMKKGATQKVRPFKRHLTQNLPARPFMVVGRPFFDNLDRTITKDLENLFMRT